jgi:hypothetical protein
MSAGIGDAVNLGWKLAAEVRGTAPDGLLDTYHSERHPVDARVVKNTLAQRILYLGDDGMQPLRDVFAELVSYEDVQRHLVGMVTGLDIKYEVGPGEHPMLGRRMPDKELDDGRSTVDLLHPARGVLFNFACDAGLRRAVSPWADRVNIVSARPVDAFAGIDAVLVRPDGYICWISANESAGEELTDALARWFGRPN